MRKPTAGTTKKEKTYNLLREVESASAKDIKDATGSKNERSAKALVVDVRRDYGCDIRYENRRYRLVGETRRHKIRHETDVGTKAWIFQSNPEFFDTRSAIKHLKELRWLVKQHGEDMNVGDRVYLWESGRNAGIVAVAQIAMPLEVQADDPASMPFTKAPQKLEGSQPRVSLRVEKIIDPPLGRPAIKADAALAGLSILQMAQGTNFAITDEERQAIDELLMRPPERDLCLIGTWKGVENLIDQTRRSIDEKGGWASPWSFPVKPDAQPILKAPFYVYLSVGQGRIPLRMRISDYTTSQGNGGQETPWPEITDSMWLGTTRGGPEPADIFKTWFRVDTIEPLVPELRISDFEPASGLSVDKSLLSPVTFGYAYRRSEDPMEALAAHTLLDRVFLEEVVSALTQPVGVGGSPQIVFAGPPGTSKTWVAEAIARHVSGDATKTHLVQFHPNYSYEAFVEGLRPVSEGGAITFKQQPGALLSLVDAMRKAGETDADSPFYTVIIDEMNRANLPRVFGELMYLFEYRDKAIRLQYSEAFVLPPNLRFIGTMNTADRSIRSIDIALRRRFDVFELRPDAGVLRRFFDKNPLNAPNLVEGFEKLNEKLDLDLDRHHTIGHAFFMRPGLDRKTLRAIWDRKIYPLIEEYFFDQLDIAQKEYVFDAFWPE